MSCYNVKRLRNQNTTHTPISFSRFIVHNECIIRTFHAQGKIKNMDCHSVLTWLNRNISDPDNCNQNSKLACIFMNRDNSYDSTSGVVLKTF